MTADHGERGLAVGLAVKLIADQFPDLAGEDVRYFGVGWDHELFSAGPRWIFRFPRRADRAAWLVREIQIMTVVSEALGMLVPRFELIGKPSPAFPYPFVGYRRIDGAGADEAGIADLSGLARDVGHLLARLHTIDVALMPNAPAVPGQDPWAHQHWAQLRARVTAAASIIRPVLPPGVRTAAEPYLAGRTPEPAEHAPARFLHNDMCPDHLIVAPGTGRLAGLIDFGDAKAGDPVLDFVGLMAGLAGAHAHADMAGGGCRGQSG